MFSSALTLLVVLPLHGAVSCPELEGVIEALDTPSRCLTPAIRAAWLQAETPRQQDCVAQAMRDRGLPSRPLATPRRSEAPPAPAPPPAPARTVADPYGASNQLLSEHFVILWNEDDGFHESWVSRLSEAFEDGWDNHVDHWGMPSPQFMEEHYFNVYLGNTGGDVPSISGGASGYFTTDDDDNPIIVIDPDILAHSDYAASTAVHEFFHACQWSTGHYVTYDSMWFWEATAVWSESEVYPSNRDYAFPLPGFAFYAYLPLFHFDYPDRGTLVEMHHYGAFIWPRYVTEHVVDSELTIDVWQQGSAGGDPLYEYDTLFYRHVGMDLEVVWGDFLARNAVWDYADRDLYVSIIDYYADWYDDESRVGNLEGAGLSAPVSPNANSPHNMGANYVELLAPAEGPLRFEFEGDNRGSSDSLSEWELRLVFEKDGAWEYEKLELDGRKVSYTGPDASLYDAIYVSIGAWSETYYEEETFSYTYRLWVEGAFPDTGLPDDTGTEPEKPGGCGCAAGTGAAPLAWFGLLGLAIARARAPARRRRRRSAAR